MTWCGQRPKQGPAQGSAWQLAQCAADAHVWSSRSRTRSTLFVKFYGIGLETSLTIPLNLPLNLNLKTEKDGRSTLSMARP